ncbi:MAG: glycoside hydrolase family 32 protein [Opitutaceae bacterium]|jgi:sucrose-6-phosphate hydrolase SacC (GH32 family)|nr:glycoside hydrolase family 32 protein [Opitutaceae bacterium]
MQHKHNIPTLLLTLLAFASAAGLQAGADTDILVSDFEFDSWAAAGWTVTGSAFGNGPVTGDFPHHRPASGFDIKGTRFVNSYLNGSDRPTGAVVSPAFTIQRPYMNFLIGAGGWPGKTCVNLLVGGKVVRTATGDYTKPAGRDAEKLLWKTWDVSAFMGQPAAIQIVDGPVTGNWGHINLDHIVQSQKPASKIIIDTLPSEADASRMETASLLEDLRAYRRIPRQTPGTAAYDTLLAEIEKRNGRENLTLADRLRGARELRDLFLADPHRPRYHLLPPEGGRHIDANGGIFHRGRYHLFLLGYEAPPAPPVLDGTDTMRSRWVWLHASSADLLHWVWQPPVKPDFDGSMPMGLYSGGIVAGAPRPTIILHTNKGTCLYTADDDDLNRWSPHSKNPVIPAPAPDGAEYNVFDPTAWKQGDTYYALIGNKNRRPGYEGDCTSLFKSPDLVNWTYIGPFYKSDRKWTLVEEDAACVDFFAIGNGRHMLVTHVHNPFRRVQYYIGAYANDTFTPERHGHMSWFGGSLGGPETLLDGKGRRLFFAWVSEHAPVAGWGSTTTLPRVLSLDAGGDLRIQPAPELEQLRANPRPAQKLAVPAGGEVVLPEHFNGDCMEIEVSFPAGQTRPHGLVVRRSPDGREQTAIIFDPAAGTLSVDFSRASLNPAVRYIRYNAKIADTYKIPENRRQTTIQTAPLKLDAGEPLTLRVYLDRSILEVYANDRQCVTQRIYPTLPDAKGVALFTAGDAMEIPRLQVFDISPTNPW